MIIEYSSNNSGGSWWLEDKDWENLRKAGWTIHDYEYKKQNRDERIVDEGEDALKFDLLSSWTKDKKGKMRWLGAIATSAHKDFPTPGDAMKEFEKITGQDVMDEGCNCCGAPHAFNWGRAIDDKLPIKAEYGYASGESCADYLFPGEKPRTLREALEERQGR
jgi:hypothetical protein